MDKRTEEEKLMEHEYDGIRELDNHMPRWYVLALYASFIFCVGYLIYYHVMGGPTQEQEYEMEMAAAPKMVKPAAVATDAAAKPLTDAASLKAGQDLFKSHTCFACHKDDMGGMVGPNLTDEFWMHGCDYATVITNVSTGFPQKGMPPFGNGTPMNETQLQQIVSYIFSKRGTNPAGAKAIDKVREVKCVAK
ncbi:MAG TPA: cbb3-type cytochrome c oxidase N-terminal domain-containing protein [Turneriella sp.]|nr:cbb3-type cytochrome c oxidase N-terminal domain-containing protein [Turneriella sp.]